MRIYLAGPIDLVGVDGQTWKKHLGSALQGRGTPQGQWTTYDPAAPWGLFNDFQHCTERSKWIELVNNAAIYTTDILVALVQAAKASVGTPIEIDFAKRHSKIIFILTDIPAMKSVYLNNRADDQHTIWRMDGEPIEDWMDRAAWRIAKVTGGYSLDAGSITVPSDAGLSNTDTNKTTALQG